MLLAFFILLLYICVCVCVLVAQLYPTLCNPIDCSLPGSSVHGILQARILEWVAIFFSKGSSWPRDWTWVSCIAGRFFTIWATCNYFACFLTYWHCPISILLNYSLVSIIIVRCIHVDICGPSSFLTAV